MWYGVRGLWRYAITFLIVETGGVIQLARGLIGDLGADARNHIAQVQGTLELRHRQLEAAIEREASNVDMFKRNIASLEGAVADMGEQATLADEGATTISASCSMRSKCCSCRRRGRSSLPSSSR